MKNLSTNLKALMGEIKISESELARRTGIGQPVVHRIASGETDNPKVGTLSPIANFFGLSISQLIGDEPMPKDRLPGSYNSEGIHGWKPVPVLSLEQILDWPNLKPQLQTIQTTSTDVPLSENAYSFKVTDDTLEPRFPNGTILFVEPALHPENRDFVLVKIDGQKLPVFKQILMDGDTLYLKPMNPEFKTIAMDDKHKFLGVIVQSRMDLVKNLR